MWPQASLALMKRGQLDPGGVERPMHFVCKGEENWGGPGKGLGSGGPHEHAGRGHVPKMMAPCHPLDINCPAKSFVPTAPLVCPKYRASAQ